MGKIIKNIEKAFTFIEILVTVSVIGFVLPIIFSIVFTIFQQQTKIYRLYEVKKQGDYVLNVSQSLITNATGVYSEASLTNQKCVGSDGNTEWTSTSGNDFYLKNIYNAPINIYLNNGKIATGTANIDLTNSKVVVSDYQISCENSSLISSPFVTVKFKVSYNTSSTHVEDTASLNYQSSYKLRSY